jgi:hypothetical protein
MKKKYEKPFARNLGEGLQASFGQILCTAGSTDTGLCTNGDAAGGGCDNGNQNVSGLGCTNGNNNAGAPGFSCINGNNNLTGGCAGGSNVTG